MQKAIFKYFTIVLIITLCVSSVVSRVILCDQMLSNTKEQLLYSVKLIEHQLDYESPLQKQVVELNGVAYEKDTRLTIINYAGDVLADSNKSSITENHSSRTEVKDALQSLLFS